MRPSLLQYFFAQWMLRLWFGVWSAFGVAFGALMAMGLLKGTIEGLLHPIWVLMVLITPIAAGAMGFFCGVLVGSIVLPPVGYWRSIVNGAPFCAGDHVRILRGPHRDEIHEVYTVWQERLEVRIRLGADAKKALTDVYSYLEVCRDTK